MPTDMTGTKPAADFRMLTVMRAAMRGAPERAIASMAPYRSNKHRRMKRLMREIARPFERFAISCRKCFKTGAFASWAPLTGLPLRQAQLVPRGDFRRIDAEEDGPGVSAILRRFAQDAGMVIDVGANAGLHAVPMARSLAPDGRLIALEPAPRKFRALQASIAANGLLGRVEAQQIAAGARIDIDTGSVMTNVATLDSLVAPGTCVDLVRIDAEGAVFAILRGMTRVLSEYPDIVVVLKFSATHLERAGATPAELIEFMAAYDLAAFLIDDANGSLSHLDPERVCAMPSADLAFGKCDLMRPVTQ